tara:strand:+ start:82 stop:234 length:153 start_codon:yes stop_codon:yes gene_type:complete
MKLKYYKFIFTDSKAEFNIQAYSQEDAMKRAKNLFLDNYECLGLKDETDR